MENFRKFIHKLSATPTSSDDPILAAFTTVLTRNGGGFGGFILFSGGEPGEVINLTFVVEVNGQFKELIFLNPVNTGTINNSNLTQVGTVTLDSTGSSYSGFQLNDYYAEDVKITITMVARSSSKPIPLDNKAYIDRGSGL